ncbi:DUF5522 domain-containing protein, partial [Spirosoma sp.]|uniref:DUF5522 domain-containing protein n=1 Tax=Spirosoma sp. TaxID=1899569 RepID=UPI003B3A31D9
SVAFQKYSFFYRSPKPMPEQSPIKKVPDLTTDDYYLTPEGYVVFTALYHKKRGYCCRNGCRHCPYDFKKKKE